MNDDCMACDIVPGKQSQKTTARPALSRTLWTARRECLTTAALCSLYTFAEERTQQDFPTVTASTHVRVQQVSPADLHRVAQVQLVQGFSAFLEAADIEEGQRVVNKAMHGAVRTVLVLVDHARDEIRGEGDDESLLKKRRGKHW